jgi:hypothetical protein
VTVCALLLIVPIVASALMNLTGHAFGPLFILPAFVLAVRAGLAPAPATHLDHCRA